MPIPIALNQRHKVGVFITVIAVGLCLVGEASLRQTVGIVLLGSAFVWAWGSGNRLLHGFLTAIGVILLACPLGKSIAEHVWAKIDYAQRTKAWEKQLPELAKQHIDLSSGLVAKADPYAAYGGAVADTFVRYGDGVGPAPDHHAFTAHNAGRSVGQIDYAALAKQAGAIEGLPPGAIITPLTRSLSIPGAGEMNFPVTMSSPDIAKSLRADNISAPSWYLKGLDAGIDAAEINGLDNPGSTPVPDSIWESLKAGYPLEGAGALLLTLFATPLILAIRSRKGIASPSP